MVRECGSVGFTRLGQSPLFRSGFGLIYLVYFVRVESLKVSETHKRNRAWSSLIIWLRTGWQGGG